MIGIYYLNLAIQKRHTYYASINCHTCNKCRFIADNFNKIIKWALDGYNKLGPAFLLSTLKENTK